MNVTLLPTPTGVGLAVAPPGLHAVTVAPFTTAPTGQVSDKPVRFGPSLLMNASLAPGGDARGIGVTTGCPGDAAIGKSLELVSPTM